jgi:hypothetical protein
MDAGVIICANVRKDKMTVKAKFGMLKHIRTLTLNCRTFAGFQEIIYVQKIIIKFPRQQEK